MATYKMSWVLWAFPHFNFRYSIKGVLFLPSYYTKESKAQSINSFSSVQFSSVQFSSVTQSCPTVCNPMNHSTPGLPVHYQLLEFT